MRIVPRQKHIFNNILHSFLLELERFSPDYRGVNQVQPSAKTHTALITVWTKSFFLTAVYFNLLGGLALYSSYKMTSSYAMHFDGLLITNNKQKQCVKNLNLQTFRSEPFISGVVKCQLWQVGTPVNLCVHNKVGVYRLVGR